MFFSSECVLSGNAVKMPAPAPAQQTNAFIRLRTKANEKVSTYFKCFWCSNFIALYPNLLLRYNLQPKSPNTHSRVQNAVAKQTLVSCVLFLMIQIAFSSFRWITLFGGWTKFHTMYVFLCSLVHFLSFYTWRCCGGKNCSSISSNWKLVHRCVGVFFRLLVVWRKDQWSGFSLMRWGQCGLIVVFIITMLAWYQWRRWRWWWRRWWGRNQSDDDDKSD